jgi:hypothetical protein
LLPGIDDGSRNDETSMEMLKMCARSIGKRGDCNSTFLGIEKYNRCFFVCKKLDERGAKILEERNPT